MTQTAQDYFTNDSNHGNYQYIKVKQIIDSLNMEAEGDSDSLLKGVPRHLLIKYAIDGVRELNFSGGGQKLGLELTIGADLQMVLPQDFVDYTEVYVVGEDKKLYLLEYNQKMNTAKTFLQDNNFEIIFDSDGDEIEADGQNIFSQPYRRYLFSGDFYAGGMEGGRNIYGGGGFRKQSNNDTSQLSRFGEFVIDKQRGVIGFSSDLQGKDVVLRYVSDGLQQKHINGEKIEIHKHLKTALEDYVYLRAIERRRNVPANEKQRARNKYRTSRHKAVLLIADINPHRINKAMRSVFRPNKF